MKNAENIYVELIREIEYYAGLMEGRSVLDKNRNLINSHLYNQEIHENEELKKEEIPFSECCEYDKNAIIETGLILRQSVQMPLFDENKKCLCMEVNKYLWRRGKFGGYYIPIIGIMLKNPEEFKRKKESCGNGDSEAWMEYYLHSLLEAAERTWKFILKYSVWNDTISQLVEKEKQKDLLENILKYLEFHSTLRIKDVAKEFNVSYNTAAGAVAWLEEQNVILEISKKRRYRIFAYAEKMMLTMDR